MYENNKSGAEKKLTISDIARDLGLSKSTISRAISGKGRISKATTLKVQDYIRKYNYKPNAIAKGLAQSKTFNIGVVLPAEPDIIEMPFFQGCLMGICVEAANQDYDVVVTMMKEDDISFLQRLVDNHKVDGVILTRSLVNDIPAQYLKRTGLPFAVIGSCEDDEIVQIDNDHVTGCCELTSILLKSGCKSLALLAGNQSYIVNRNRYTGFLKAFQDLNISLNNSMVFLDMNSNMLIDRAVKTAMDRHVDCIICSDDLICSRALVTLNNNGYKIPDDVKIASFYNNAHLDNYNPPITALSIDPKELGITAAKRLIDIISGTQGIQKTWVNYEIVLKKSTK